MKIKDFFIGKDFFLRGESYHCTDVGSRTVSAICTDNIDKKWITHRPLMVEERLLSERDIGMCSEKKDCSLELEHKMDKVLAFSEVAQSVIANEQKHRNHSYYPMKGIFGIERVRPDGKAVYPYSARQYSDKWIILCYIQETQSFIDVQESAFLSYELAEKNASEEIPAVKKAEPHLYLCSSL